MIVGSSTALHLLTAGAIGVLTLGMMAWVSLGHTGRELVTPKVITFAFGLVVLAALLRVAGPWIGGAFAAGSLHGGDVLGARLHPLPSPPWTKPVSSAPGRPTGLNH